MLLLEVRGPRVGGLALNEAPCKIQTKPVEKALVSLKHLYVVEFNRAGFH